MRHRHPLVTIALIGAGALALAGCSAPGTSSPQTAADADPAAPEQSSVSVATFRATAAAPVLMGQEASDDAYGLTIEPAFIESSAAGVSQLVSGDVDFGFSSYFGVIDAVNQGIPLRLVSEDLASAPDIVTLEALPGSGITGLEDLEGRKVAVPSLNSSLDIKITYAMTEAGLDPDTVEFVELPYGEVGAALETGTVDAGSLQGVAQATVRDTLGTEVVFDYGSGEFEGFAESGWLVTQSFLDANPNTVAAFQCTVQAGAEAAMNDDEAYTAMLKDDLGYDDAAIAATVKPSIISGLRIEALQQSPDMLFTLGLIDEEFDMSAIVVPFPEDC
ncbi:hypothetical protein GCM10027416_01160 [Okibacterium endophyticum]